jgi:hypothetical protein
MATPPTGRGRGRGSSPHNLVYLNRDKGYRFKDRDPVLEEVTNLIEKSGLSTNAISELTAKVSHNTVKVSPGTMDRWLNGKTFKPQNYTVSWVGYALGYERRWQKLK